METLNGKIAIVTGANSGMGLATAEALSDRGATVIMLCRSEERGKAAIAALKGKKERDLDLMLCDLGDYASIREFARCVKEKYRQIDILVNNAGFISLDRQETKEGVERQFGINHLGHFLLTTQLTDMMKPGSRIVVQVEEIHLNAKKLEHCRACGNGWGTCNKKGTCVIQDDFAGIYKTISEADGIVWISAVYWSEMTECFKAFFDRLRRCDAAHNHFLAEKRCILAACAGGTGRGTQECLQQMERGLVHMGMRTYDRISVVRYNKDYILSAMYEAGRTYADRLETGFDMYY